MENLTKLKEIEKKYVNKKKHVCKFVHQNVFLRHEFKFQKVSIREILKFSSAIPRIRKKYNVIHILLSIMLNAPFFHYCLPFFRP